MSREADPERRKNRLNSRKIRHTVQPRHSRIAPMASAPMTRPLFLLFCRELRGPPHSTPRNVLRDATIDMISETAARDAAAARRSRLIGIALICGAVGAFA